MMQTVITHRALEMGVQPTGLLSVESLWSTTQKTIMSVTPKMSMYYANMESPII